MGADGSGVGVAWPDSRHYFLIFPGECHVSAFVFCFHELVERRARGKLAEGPSSDGAIRRASADALAVMPTDPIMTKDGWHNKTLQTDERRASAPAYCKTFARSVAERQTWTGDVDYSE